MSLLKARRIIDKNVPTVDSLELEAQTLLDEFISTPNKEELYKIIDIYSQYSYVYLLLISRTLKPQEGMKTTMTYLNSFIAEMCHEVTIPYFDREQGFSVIDKSVQYVLDNGIQTDTSYVQTIVEEMIKVKEEFESQDEL